MHGQRQQEYQPSSALEGGVGGAEIFVVFQQDPAAQIMVSGLYSAAEFPAKGISRKLRHLQVQDVLVVEFSEKCVHTILLSWVRLVGVEARASLNWSLVCDLTHVSRCWSCAIAGPQRV